MSEELRRISNLSGLAVEPAVLPGIQIFVEEDQHVYISVGHTTPTIAARLGWTQGNIWMPAYVLRYVQRNHPVLDDPISIASTVLQHPISVHQDRREMNAVYFIIGGATLYGLGLLQSRSIPYVDAVVELRQTMGHIILRLFHLSPRDRNHGGAQLWP